MALMSTQLKSLHIQILENRAECSEPDLFLSSSRAVNVLTYFVCGDAIIHSVNVALVEGKGFYHIINFAYGLVCFAVLAGCLAFKSAEWSCVCEMVLIIHRHSRYEHYRVNNHILFILKFVVYLMRKR